MNKIMSKKVTVVRKDPSLLNSHDNLKTDRDWGQSWWKSHKQETPTLLTDADKSTDIKKNKTIFVGSQNYLRWIKNGGGVIG